METNIGKQFFVLINKHFPEHNRLYKICNCYNIKISYSCVLGIGHIILVHNKHILGESQVTPDEAPPCNCRKKMNCLLDSQCQRKATIYQALVKSQDMNMQNYVGLCREIMNIKLRICREVMNIREDMNMQNYLGL